MFGPLVRLDLGRTLFEVWVFREGCRTVADIANVLQPTAAIGFAVVGTEKKQEDRNLRKSLFFSACSSSALHSDRRASIRVAAAAVRYTSSL